MLSSPSRTALKEEAGIFTAKWASTSINLRCCIFRTDVALGCSAGVFGQSETGEFEWYFQFLSFAGNGPDKLGRLAGLGAGAVSHKIDFPIHLAVAIGARRAAAHGVPGAAFGIEEFCSAQLSIAAHGIHEGVDVGGAVDGEDDAVAVVVAGDIAQG